MKNEKTVFEISTIYNTLRGSHNNWVRNHEQVLRGS